MDPSDSILKKLDNITYILELTRNEIENAITDSLLEFGDGYSEKLEIKDVEEDDGKILQGFFAILDRDKGVIIEFRDGKKVPLNSLETDNMYDIFVRLHSALLDEAVSLN
jgi:hypothetical protein